MADRAAVEALLARADRLDAAGLLALGTSAAPPDALEGARRRARDLIHEKGLEAELERLEGCIAAWSFVDGARTGLGAVTTPAIAGVGTLRRQAAAGLLDAVVAMLLGPSLDVADQEVLLAAWRGRRVRSPGRRLRPCRPPDHRIERRLDQ